MPSQNSIPLVELVDVAVAPAEVVNPDPLIQHVDWTICEGDFWAVAGLPGSGKTDLLSTAAALQKPLDGEQLIFGKNIRYMDEQEMVQCRLRIGMVFANGRLFNQMSIQDNIALPICYHRNCAFEEAWPQVQTALRVTELEKHASKNPGQVTRNLQPRIARARALALRPELLLIDNTLPVMDPRQGKWWLECLKLLAVGHPELGGKRITIVAATDDYRPWLSSATCFAAIQDRRWIKVGAAADLEAATDPNVKEFLLASHRHWS
jgi:ABC-type transporter Mla maintaining outer membrane lipid asymmetry ATPase subunit MlaF